MWNKTGGTCHLLFPDTINSNIFVNFYCTQDTEYVMPHRDPKTWSVFTGDVWHCEEDTETNH